jgi:ubiquinone/menaquinone biosynthesis C-methylase UbiE/DNA-binding transcriptional ArsR family regulator
MYPDTLMDRKTAQQPEALLSRMSSLADATRLRLLRLLEEQELGVVDLCDVLQMPQSTISRHLKILADHGWVRSRRDATTHLYRSAELESGARRLWFLAREQTGSWATIQQDALRLRRRLRQRQDRSQEFFAGAARDWERLRSELYGDSFLPSAMLALLPSSYVVADLGCGTGQVSRALAPAVHRVIAVDNSPAMLRAARKRAAGFPNVELRQGDLASLPLEDASCDAAVLILALTYVARPAQVLREAARILKLLGKLVLVDLLPHDREDFQRQMGQQCRGFSTDQTREMLELSGFESIAIDPLPPEFKAKGPALFLAAAIRGPETPHRENQQEKS